MPDTFSLLIRFYIILEFFTNVNTFLNISNIFYSILYVLYHIYVNFANLKSQHWYNDGSYIKDRYYNIYGCEVSELNWFCVAYETTKIPYLPLAIYIIRVSPYK